MTRWWLPVLIAAGGFAPTTTAAPPEGARSRVKALRIVVLSTMLAEKGVGETTPAAS